MGGEVGSGRRNSATTGSDSGGKDKKKLCLALCSTSVYDRMGGNDSNAGEHG